MPPIVAFSRYPSARWASLFGSGLRHYVAGSPGHQAESSSSSYGPVSRFRLLPTSPHGDAVTFSFRPESVCLKRTCTSLNECACGRTTCRQDAGAPRENSRPILLAHDTSERTARSRAPAVPPHRGSLRQPGRHAQLPLEGRLGGREAADLFEL